MVKRRTILESLTLARLLELAQDYGISDLTGQRKDELVATLSCRRSLSTNALLSELSSQELKATCGATGLDDSGRAKAPIIGRILGNGDVSAAAGDELPGSDILLLEDNASTAERRISVGVGDRDIAAKITVRVHRFNGERPVLAGSRSYKSGSMRNRRAGRIEVALRLIDDARPTRETIVVAGTSYGSSACFVEALAARSLDYVVHIRPSSCVVPVDEGARPVRAGALLEEIQWREITAPLPDGVAVQYLAGVIAEVRLGRAEPAKLLAAQVGSVQGVNRGTMILLSSFNASLQELVRLANHAPWIRIAARRDNRQRAGSSASRRPRGSASSLIVRANISLARQQDTRVDEAHREPIEMRRAGGIISTLPQTLNVAELFAGAGGMGLGFLLANQSKPRYRLLFSGEANPIYVQTLRRNHKAFDEIWSTRSEPVVPTTIDAVDLRQAAVLREVRRRATADGGIHILIGGPPCQGFSVANRNSWDGRNPNNKLVEVFLEYVEALRPRIFLMENVQGILWAPKGGRTVSVVDVLERRLIERGYLVFPKLLDAVWYGVPQHRTRFFLMGIDRDLGFGPKDFGTWGPFPTPTHGVGGRAHITVADAIRDLPEIGNGAGEESLPYKSPSQFRDTSSTFLEYLREDADAGVIYDHITSKHAAYVIDRYRQIPAGGNWESIRDMLTNYANVGRTHSNIYRRLLWDEPSITIGHYRKSMLVHPEQHRGLSLREAARLQSFPDWFRFIGSADGSTGGLVHKQQQLANAVCPLVTKAVAEFILQL